MKKLLACFLALMLALTGAALAEPADAAATPEPVVVTGPTYPTDELVVGATTALSGNFFNEMWGNNTSDLDVRMLLHGYNLVQREYETGMFVVDDSVVSGLVVTREDNGDRTYTLELYDDMTYSDGTPITARDYAFSILLSMAPEMAAIGAATNASNHIVGSDEYKAGTAGALAGLRVLSDTQLSLRVKAEYLPFFYELGLLNYTPYPISVIAPGCEVADDGEGAYIRNIDSAVTEPIFTAELLERRCSTRKPAMCPIPRWSAAPTPCPPTTRTRIRRNSPSTKPTRATPRAAGPPSPGWSISRPGTATWWIC